MPVYPDSASLYTVLRTTFTRLVRESPGQLDGLHSLIAARLILQLRTTSPAAEITLNGRESKIQIVYGKYAGKADLVVDLASDALHEILLDRLSIKTAWKAGQIKAAGPVWKLKVLTDLVKGARQYYPAVVREYDANQPAPPVSVKPGTVRTKKRPV